MSSSSAKYIYSHGPKWEIMVKRSMIKGRRFTYERFTSIIEAQFVRDTWLTENGYELPDDSPWKDSTLPASRQEAIRQSLVSHFGELPPVLRFPVVDVNRSLPENPPENSTASLVHPPLHITLSGAFICSDLHAPYHNREMLTRLVKMREHHPNASSTLCIVGDLFNFETLSKHPQHEPAEGLRESLRIGRDILLWFREYFETIYICNGNHDERLAGKALNAHYPLDHVINGLFDDTTNPGGIVVTNNDYIVIDTPGSNKRWVLVHPSKYSKNGGTTPALIAPQFQANVISGHNHRVGVQSSHDGKWLGVDLGHMTNTSLHYYKRRRANTFAEWNSGFAVLENGYVTSYMEDWTDWSKFGL